MLNKNLKFGIFCYLILLSITACLEPKKKGSLASSGFWMLGLTGGGYE